MVHRDHLKNRKMAEQTLLQQIIDFCSLLRQVGVNVTTTNQLSWCRSVQLIAIGEREIFYHTALTNLISKDTDREVFDIAFNLFWCHPRAEFQTVDAEIKNAEPSSLQDLSDVSGEQNHLEKWVDFDTEGDEEGRQNDLVAYSAEEVLARKDFSEFTTQDMEKAREIIAKLAALLATKLSRRKVLGKKGKTIDFRRSWRKSLSHGGEPIELIRKQQKIKKTKILLICDVSGSMECYAKFLIQFIYGMQKELREVDVAVFSTHMTNITGLLRSRGVREGLNEVANVVPDWSGGTKIGESLLECYRQFSTSFSTYRSVVLLISDGWDRGEAGVLRHAMEMLHRHAYRLIWLNPLLGSDSYQPICRGIRTALPYIDYFLPAHNLESLEELTKLLIPLWVQ